MKQFNIYTHPAGMAEAVKQGWSWPAFFFGFMWAFAKRQWALGGAVLGGAFALGFVLGLIDAGLAGGLVLNLASFILTIVFGLNGNAWREKNLMSRGYTRTDTVTAANAEAALALMSKAGLAGRPSTA